MGRLRSGSRLVGRIVKRWVSIPVFKFSLLKMLLYSLQRVSEETVGTIITRPHPPRGRVLFYTVSRCRCVRLSRQRLHVSRGG